MQKIFLATLVLMSLAISACAFHDERRDVYGLKNEQRHEDNDRILGPRHGDDDRRDEEPRNDRRYENQRPEDYDRHNHERDGRN